MEAKRSRERAKEKTRRKQQGRLHVSKQGGAANKSLQCLNIASKAANRRRRKKNRGRRVASWNCAPPRAQQHCHELLQDVIGAAAWLAGACNACCAFFADGGESAKGRTVVAAGGVLDAPVGVGSSGQACEKEEACPLG